MMDVYLIGCKMVGVILKTITLDVIGMEVTVVTILILNGKNIVTFRNFVNVSTQVLVLQLHYHLLQHPHQHRQHQHLALADVELQTMPLMKIVMMRTIMLLVTSTMGLVVVTMFQQCIVPIVNVLTQILEHSFMKSLLE